MQIKWKVLLFSLSILSIFSVSAHASLSNQLPLDLVKGLIDHRLWLSSLDNDQSPEAQEISAFYNALLNSGVTNSEIRDLTFASTQIKNGFQQVSTTYPIKIFILRNLVASPNPQIRSKAQVAVHEIIFQYVQMTMTLIKSISMPEYNPILDRLASDLTNNQILLEDLSDQQRELLSISSRARHSSILLQKNQGLYLVNGLFSNQDRKLYVDISKPISESLITLAHEIVHAADPEIIEAQKKLTQNYSVVLNQLQSRFKNQLSSEVLAAALQDLFFELGQSEVLNSFTSLPRSKAQFFAKLSENKDLKSLMSSPEIASWMEALLRTSVENEFRAYLYSLSVYAQLSSQGYQILPPLESREQFLSHVFSHEIDFAKSLSTAMDPFNRSTYLGALLLNQDVAYDTREAILDIRLVMESQYVAATARLLKQIPEKYAHLIALTESQSTAQRAEATWNTARWVQNTEVQTPESPLNPFTILTVKLSTTWTLRMKRELQNFANHFLQLHETLLVTKAGVLDFKNLNMSDLQLIGAYSTQAGNGSLPTSLRSLIGRSYLEETMTMQNLFNPYFWPQAHQESEALSTDVIRSRLIELTLTRSTEWLRVVFPNLHTNSLTAIRVLRTKLQNGYYDSHDISPTRRTQLIAELDESLNYLRSTPDDVVLSRYLLKALLAMRSISLDPRFYNISREFDHSSYEVLKILDNMGMESSLRPSQLQNNSSNLIDQQVDAFRGQVNRYYKNCASITPMVPMSDGAIFELASFKVQLTMVCFNRKIFVMRQPQDFSNYAITLEKMDSKGGTHLETSLFLAGRPLVWESFNGAQK